MEIEVSTSGGLTAGMRYGHTPRVLRTDQLDPRDTRALTELVQRARAAAEPQPGSVDCADGANGAAQTGAAQAGAAQAGAAQAGAAQAQAGAAQAQTGAAPPPRRMPDAMSYTITVRDGSRAAVLKESDADMTDEFAALLDWVQGRLADR